MTTTAMTYARDVHHDQGATNVYGFWIYIMSDCVLFSCLFAAYAVLHVNVFGGPDGKELFSLPFVFVETMLLLTSSFTCGLMMLAINKTRQQQAIFWMAVTFLLGLSFVVMEVYEFHELVVEGNSWSRSAFLSSFFTLVGTHGLHVSLGLLWMVVLLIQILKHGITPVVNAKLQTFSLFWHFLDIVWIFLFTIVYLIGAT